MVKVANLKHGIRKKKIAFLKKYYKVKDKTKYPFIYLLINFIKILEILVIILLALVILQQFNVIKLNSINNFLKNYIPSTDEDLNQQFLFSQISITFIILTLFSLITNMKRKKILGTSIYGITFAKSILGNITFISLIIFTSLFTNIFLYLKNANSNTILYLFLITLFILTLLIIKVIFYTNSLNLSINKISSIYYWENRKLVRKPKITWKSGNRVSEYLFNLNEDTFEKISRKDIGYRRNLHVYDKITELSLANYKYKIQENYTEFVYEPDIIIMWTACIEELIKNELYTDALRQYNAMTGMFITNQVYLSSRRINNLLEQIFTSISATENKLVFEQNKELLLMSIRLTMGYGYYKDNNDFSYTRLKRQDLSLFLSPLYGNFMNDFYDLIDKKIGLNDIERSEELVNYFESLKMISFDVTNTYNVTPLKIKYFEVSKELRKYNDEVILAGIPLSKLLLSIMQENKKSRVLYFLNDFNNNSIYLACLVLSSKLATLLFQIKASKEDSVSIKTVEYYLILTLSKLIELKDQQVKFYCFEIKRTLNKSENNIYETVNFTPDDVESLSVVKQVIMIKKKNIDINNISITNRKLKTLITLFFEGYNTELLKQEQKREQQEIVNRFGILIQII